ncbi:MAG TPA: hypothetical protein VEB20_06295 [Azospirillaceae bacterium]|nr:hypothetical protein [Azospirillaceae bacterium]
MDVVYVYQGGRDEALEREVREMIPGARQICATPGMGGMTEVTIRVPDGGDLYAVQLLRGRARIIDASRGSMGEGA